MCGVAGVIHLCAERSPQLPVALRALKGLLQHREPDGSGQEEGLASEPQFGRKPWSLLSLEIRQQQFPDRESRFQQLPARAAGDYARVA